MTHMICMVLPIHIISEANIRSHWRVKAIRVASHREIASTMLRKHQPPPAPAQRRTPTCRMKNQPPPA